MISSDFRTEARRKLDGKWGKAALITLAYMFIFFLLSFIQGLLDEDSIFATLFNIAQFIIEVPLSFGFIIALFKLYKSEDVSPFDYLSLGFSNFKKSWQITFKVALKLIVPIIILIVSIVLIGLATTTFAVSPLLTMYQSTFNDTAYDLAYSVTSPSPVAIILLVVGFIFMVVAYIWIFTKSYYYKLAYLVAIDNETLSAKEAIEKSEKMMTGKRAKLFWLELSFIGWALLALLTLGIGFLWLIPYIQFATISFYFFASKNDVVTEVPTDTIDKSEE